MAEVCGEVEDDLIDLNKEPVERKRKRVESVQTDGGDEGINGLPKAGKVLRSRTRAMSDGETQEMKMEDKEKIEVSLLEEKDDSHASVLSEKKRVKRRRGRPPKSEGKCEVSSLRGRKKGRRGRPPKAECNSDDSFSSKPKGRRGRPPKMEGKREVSSLGKPLGQEKVDGVSNGVKRRPGRPPRTMENENVGLPLDKKNAEDEVFANKLKVGKNNLGNGIVKHKKGKVDRALGNELGLREQKQLLRDQIVAMLMKAGWTVEYRQRQSKDYQDAVYVDREGKTHWSVTLAYKKFKEKIDSGKAKDIDVTAFNPIPEETLSKLFRVTVIGKKVGKKRTGGNTIRRSTKNHIFRIKTFDGYVKSKFNQGKQRNILARRRRDGSDSGGHELYEGSRSLLAWMIDLGTVPLDEKVIYKKGKNKKPMLEGRLLKEGICCGCCGIMYSVTGFETHAKSPPGKPYQNIYLNSGNSLFQCLLDSWKKHVETDKIEFVSVDLEGDDPNDDTCNVCGDGGDLICCDSCPSTFHHGCLHAKVPPGDWYCAYCSCKYCEMPCKSPSSDDDDDDDDDCNLFSESLTCRSCEEKFHVSCNKGGLVEENPSFCGKGCLKIFEQLRGLLGVRHELKEGYSYTILQHCALSGDASHQVDPKIVECNSKLAVAFTVMDECFESIIDERSGANLIHNVIYSCGSNIRRLNFDGFYTIILEKGDELVAVATIRIHGSQVAEMPFIGTRFLYRRQGMCSCLLAAIETVLCSLGVEKLVIPAISELNETWTKVFGFVPLVESERLEMRHMSMIVFPGVAMLKKSLPKSQMESADAKCTEVGAEDQIKQENPFETAEEVKPKSIGAVTETLEEEQCKDNASVDVSKSDVSSQVMIHAKDNDNDVATASVIALSGS